MMMMIDLAHLRPRHALASASWTRYCVLLLLRQLRLREKGWHEETASGRVGPMSTSWTSWLLRLLEQGRDLGLQIGDLRLDLGVVGLKRQCLLDRRQERP